MIVEEFRSCYNDRGEAAFIAAVDDVATVPISTLEEAIQECYDDEECSPMLAVSIDLECIEKRYKKQEELECKTQIDEDMTVVIESSINLCSGHLQNHAVTQSFVLLKIFDKGLDKHFTQEYSDYLPEIWEPIINVLEAAGAFNIDWIAYCKGGSFLELSVDRNKKDDILSAIKKFKTERNLI